MVLQLAPPGTASNLCLGLEQALAARPPPPQWHQAFNAAVLYGYIVAMVLSHLAWHAFRHTPRLRSRPVMLVFLVNVGVLCGTIAVAGKRVHVDPVTLQPDFPCLALTFMWLVTAPLNVSVFLVRMFRETQELQFAQLARGYKRHELGDAEVESSPGGARRSGTGGGGLWSAHSDSGRQALGVLQYLKGLLMLMRESFASPPAQTAQNEHVLETRLETLAFSHRPNITLALFLVLNVPNLIIVLIIYLAADVYRGNCSGCDLYWETLIAFTLYGGLLACMMFRLFWLLRAAPDKNGAVHELRLSLGACNVFMMSGFALEIGDPMQLDYRNEFEFEWIVLLGLLALWFFGTPVQVFIAAKQAWRSNSRVSDGWHTTESSRLERQPVANILDALRDAGTRDRFENFAVEHMVIESSRFLTDVGAWRDLFYERSNEWRLAKARRLVRTYVEQRAVMQVNISATDRQVLERAVAQDGAVLDITLFEDALKSIAKMLSSNGGAWHMFVKQGGLGQLQVKV
jgi:hypothetical protein